MTLADDVGNMRVAIEPIMAPIMGSGRTQKSPEPKFTPFTRVLVQHSKRYGLTPCSTATEIEDAFALFLDGLLKHVGVIVVA